MADGTITTTSAHDAYSTTVAYEREVELQERCTVARETREHLQGVLDYLDSAGARMTQAWVDLHDYRAQLDSLIQAINRGDDDLARRSEAWASLDSLIDRHRAARSEAEAFYAEHEHLFVVDERSEEAL